jgi:hypothetical protein
MQHSLLAVPAALLGTLAWVSFRTGGQWMRYRQWDAVATHFAIGAGLGGIAAGLAAKAVRAES